MINRIRGKSNWQYLPKLASTTYRQGTVCYPDGSGSITTATTFSNVPLGIVMEDVLYTDSDYSSSTKKIAVDILSDGDTFEADASIADVETLASVQPYLTNSLIGKTYNLNTNKTHVNVLAATPAGSFQVLSLSGSKVVVNYVPVPNFIPQSINLSGPASRPGLLIMGNSIAGQSCRTGVLYTSRIATVAGTGIKPGTNQITLVAGGVAALGLLVNDYIVIQLCNQQPWPVQVTAIAGELLTLARRTPLTLRSASTTEAGVSKVTPPVLFGGTWRQQYGIHNYANAFIGGLFDVLPGFGHGGATAEQIIEALPRYLAFYRPAVVMLSILENDVPGTLTAAQMIAIADQAAGLCLSFGATPIVLHSLPSNSISAARADEYDDLRAGVLSIGNRVPGAIGIDPGSIYLDTSNGTSPRRGIPSWTDGVVHPLESKRATIALNGGLAAALLSCAKTTSVDWKSLLWSTNKTLSGTGGTAGAGTSGVIAANTTISATGAGMTVVASKNADDSQRLIAVKNAATVNGSDLASVIQTYTLPVTWSYKTRLKMVAEVTIHSQENLSALRLSTSFGSQAVDMRTSASSEPFDTTILGKKIVIESMAFPMLDSAVTSAALTFDLRANTATLGFNVDATIHNIGFVLTPYGELDGGAVDLL